MKGKGTTEFEGLPDNMISEIRCSVEAPWTQGRLRVFEPTWAEVQAAAPSLAAFYNDSHNSTMMTNTR